MDVLRGPSPAQHPFSFWLVRVAGSSEGPGQVGGAVEEEETVDLQLAVGRLRRP